jgi:hypothetical protein
MIVRFAFDPKFLEEREKCRLRHTCEECAHFDHHLEECAHGWPNRAHREAYYAEEGRDIVFCKEFELG